MIPPVLALPANSTTRRRRSLGAARRARETAWRLAHVLRQALHDDKRAWVSGHLWVPVTGKLQRPDVGVILGDPPRDGVLTGPPCLVVEHASAPCPVHPQLWLEAGVQEVWTVGDGEVDVHRRDRDVTGVRKVTGVTEGTAVTEQFRDDQGGQSARLRVPGTTVLVAVASLRSVHVVRATRKV